MYYDKKHKAICILLLNGKTLEEVGKRYGLTRERIRQIFRKYHPNEEVFGKAKEIKDRTEKRKSEIKERFNREVYKGLTDLERAQGLFFTRKRQNTKSAGKWEFEITMSDLVWHTHCPMLGLELDWTGDYRKENSPSIDRIDSSKGYVKGNVVLCSWRANRLKNNGTAEEHRKIADFLDSINASKTRQNAL